MDKRFSLSHTVLIHQRESEHPSSTIFLKKKYSSRHTNTITTAYYYTPVFSNIGPKRGQSEPNITYLLLNDSQQKRAAKNYLRQVFGNIGLKGSPGSTLLMPYSLTANKKELRRIILDRFSVI